MLCVHQPKPQKPTATATARVFLPSRFCSPHLQILSKAKPRMLTAAPATASRPLPPPTPPPRRSTMVSATFPAFAALGVAFTAIELFPFLGLQSVVPSTSMTTQDSTFDSAAIVSFTAVELFPFQVLLLFAATVALFTAVAVIHLHHAAAAAVGAGNKRLSELVPFTLCTAAGILVFFLFLLPAGVDDDDVGALARALGRAAVHALPASATVAFFLGITLVIAHIRAGGEGGGGGAVADNRRVPVSVDILKKVALGVAATLLSQIAMAALYVK